MSTAVNLRFEWLVEERVVVLYHGPNEAVDSEWDDYLALLKSLEGTQPVRVFVYTEGGRPTRDQQQRLLQTEKQRGPVAVVSPSTPVSFVVSVFALVLPAIQLFAPEQMEEAVAFLGCSPEALPVIRAALERCKLALATVEKNAPAVTRPRTGTGPVRDSAGSVRTSKRASHTDPSLDPRRRDSDE